MGGRPNFNEEQFPINRCHQRLVTAAPERACAAGDPRIVCAPLTLAAAERGVKPVENTEIQCAAGAGVWAIGQGGRKGPGDADDSRSADHGDPRTRGAHPECQSRPDHSAGSLRKRSFIRWFIIDSDQQVPGSKLGGIATTWSSQLLVHPGQLSSRCWLQNAHRSRSGPGRSNSWWS